MASPEDEKGMCLWVDDLRPAPEGWDWVKSSRAAIAVLKTLPVAIMSLDHDLGGEDTTRPVVLWLCEHPERWPAEVRVHSANPVGVEWLTGMVARYHQQVVAPESNRAGSDRGGAGGAGDARRPGSGGDVPPAETTLNPWITEEHYERLAEAAEE